MYISLDQRGAIGACEGQCFGGVPVAKEETEDGQMKGGKKGRRQEKSKCIVVGELKCTVFRSIRTREDAVIVEYIRRGGPPPRDSGAVRPNGRRKR